MMEKVTEFKVKDAVCAVHITDIPEISLFKTFDCGQCFRFDPVSMFGHKYEVGGVALGKYIVFAQDSEDELYIYNATEQDYKEIWRKYLCLDTDYDEINSAIMSACPSEHMKRAVEYGKGIRILRQEPIEAIISFIISQNNNIPRIKKIIASICAKYGHTISLLDKQDSTFPTLDALLCASVEELFSLKMGFRAKYIFDACRLLDDGSVKIDYLLGESDFEKCISHLCQIKGVGLKVASCALLFGFGKTRAFPIDVHMKRTLERYFPEGIDIEALGENAGIAQQYLFYYEKYK